MSWQNERTRLRAQSAHFDGFPDWTAIELRQHRILDRIFKAVEKEGLVPRAASQPRVFSFQYKAIEISCSLREKKRRLREQKASTGDTVFILKPTGDLIFKIESNLGPGDDIRREWLETSDKRLDTVVPDIISSILRAGPVLLRQWQQQQELIRKSFEAMELREIEATRRRTDRNRWQAFIEYAHRLAIVDQVEGFIAHLEDRASDLSTIIDGRSLSDWLQWARSHLETFNPRLLSAEAMFAEIAELGDGPISKQNDGFRAP